MSHINCERCYWFEQCRDDCSCDFFQPMGNEIDIFEREVLSDSIKQEYYKEWLEYISDYK